MGEEARVWDLGKCWHAYIQQVFSACCCVPGTGLTHCFTRFRLQNSPTVLLGTFYRGETEALNGKGHEGRKWDLGFAPSLSPVYQLQIPSKPFDMTGFILSFSVESLPHHPSPGEAPFYLALAG